MNKDQTINLIQTVFKIGGGMLASKGILDDSTWEAVAGGVIALVTWFLSHKWNATDSDGGTQLNLFLFLLFIPALLISGCAQFDSQLEKTAPDGTVTRSHQRITTLFDAHSDVQKLRASTTDKTQGLTVGSISDDTSGTNAVQIVNAVVQAAVTGAVKAAAPTP